MLLHDAAERKKRKAVKTLTLLKFLKEETYSDFNILRSAIGFSKTAHSPLYRLLQRLTDEGFIIKYEMQGAKKKTIWGITMQGLALVVNENDTAFPGYFEPSKIKYITLEHKILNQRVRIALQARGGSGWINCDKAEFMARFSGVNHRPDGLITLNSGAIVAIEAERTLKTKARYISIIASHLAAINARHWHYVIYVLPDQTVKNSIMKLFEGIKTVIIKNVPAPFDENARKNFLFRTIAELEKQENV